MGLGGRVRGVRCALTPEQVAAYSLPRSPDALKLTDTRAKKYMARFGDLAVELDAIAPPALEELVRESIKRHLDLSQFNRELAAQTAERAHLGDLRDQVRQMMEQMEAME